MVLVDDRPDGEDKRSIMKMIFINKRGSQRIREVESFSKDYGKNKKSVMVFKEPADVKGTAFLSWDYDGPKKEDDKWLYLPALKKVRRISGTSKSEYFMGTDFAYDDMGDRHIDEDKHALLEEQGMDGQKCWKIESIPINKKDMYTRKNLWIGQESLLKIKAEFCDKDGLIKTYRMLSVGEQD
jgi:hypothetical protein